MLVVNEPELVEAVNRLRGEWAERSGGELKATGTTWKELIAAKEIDADVVIFPSRYLGELCVRDGLRPVRASVLESEELNVADFFPLIRNDVMKWGGQIMAVPLGVDPSVLGSTAIASPAISLLTDAAPNAISNDRIGVLFDSETMKPQITEPAFVDALTQLTNENGSAKSGRKNQESELPVVGYADRIAAVTLASRNAASAFKLLEWLAGSETSSQLARGSTGQLPVRRSLAAAVTWYDSSLSANERTERGKSLSTTLSGEKLLLLPRIPAIDEYIAALDDAVKSATDKKVSPKEALQAAAQNWEKITDAHGREKQRAAYQKHLGIR